MKVEVYILDFEDSFTYNVASEIQKLGLPSEVVPFNRIPGFLFDTAKTTHSPLVLVYGPGPGRPRDYFDLYSLVRPLLAQKNIFHLGICLGHQLLWDVKENIASGASITPMHGRKIAIRIPKWKGIFHSNSWGTEVTVQRYNSLVLDLPESAGKRFPEQYYFSGKECLMGRFERGLTYQFHPESVGTSCPSMFFAGPLGFLYNDRDEQKIQNRGHLRLQKHAAFQGVGDSAFRI